MSSIPELEYQSDHSKQNEDKEESESIGSSIPEFEYQSDHSKQNDIIIEIKCTKEEGQILEGPEYNFYDNFGIIENVGELFQDIDYVRYQFQPLNHSQAIVAAAYNLNKDISKTKYPLQEFTNLNQQKPIQDPFLKTILDRNPNYLDFYFYFNPYLPKNLYKEKILEHHIQQFSFHTYLYIGIETYEILQELHLEENFYLGWHPNIINYETPIDLDVVDKLPNHEIICYGVRGESLMATTWNELFHLFKNMNLFVNPFVKNSVFPPIKIERLLKLAKWIINPPWVQEHLFHEYNKEIISNCMEIMDTLILFQKSEFEMFKEYNNQYQQMTKEQKDNIEFTFEKLFELILYMRGWSEGQPYPISQVPYSDNDMTEKRTLNGLIVLDEWNEKINGFLYQLPLIIWKNEFVKSHQEEQGLTIGERIKIVKNGESDNINSCIRMTSNVLGASYCFYSKLFKFKEKFDIKDLNYIQ